MLGMTIGCNTGGPWEGVSYRGSHNQTMRVGRSAPRIHNPAVHPDKTAELRFDGADCHSW